MEKNQRTIEASSPHTSPTLPSAPPTSPVAQANPEQTLLHVWPVLMSRGLNALLHSLGQLPQFLDLPQVLICFLALFLGEVGMSGIEHHDGEYPHIWPPVPLECSSNELQRLEPKQPQPTQSTEVFNIPHNCL